MTGSSRPACCTLRRGDDRRCAGCALIGVPAMLIQDATARRCNRPRLCACCDAGTNAHQALYVCLVGTFPFNSFLAALFCCVGSAVLTGEVDATRAEGLMRVVRKGSRCRGCTARTILWSNSNSWRSTTPGKTPIRERATAACSCRETAKERRNGTRRSTGDRCVPN